MVGTIALVERRLALPEDVRTEPPGVGQLLALVDSLHKGTLNEAQTETIRQLRNRILAPAERESIIQNGKVPTHSN